MKTKSVSNLANILNLLSNPARTGEESRHNIGSVATKKQNVLLISSFAQSSRVLKMASALLENGFNVTILEWDRDSIFPPIEYKKNILIRRMKLKAPYGYRVIFKMIFWQFYIAIVILFGNFTIIQPQNLDNLLPVWFLRPFKKFKIVYDVADFYADTFILPNMTLLRRIIAWIERLLAKTADATILVDESRRQQINIPGCIIYNSPPDIFNTLKVNNNVNNNEEISSRSKFVIFYAGALSRDRGLDNLIKAVWGLADVELIIAGFGELYDIFSHINQWKSNIHFLGRIPYDDALRLTATSDCIVALYDPMIPNNRYASPSKLFEAMMCAKPIIINRETTAARIVEKFRCGMTVPYGDVEALRNAIKLLKENDDLCTLLGQNGRKAYKMYFEWNLMEKRLVSIYNQITQEFK